METFSDCFEDELKIHLLLNTIDVKKSTVIFLFVSMHYVG